MYVCLRVLYVLCVCMSVHVMLGVVGGSPESKGHPSFASFPPQQGGTSTF